MSHKIFPYVGAKTDKAVLCSQRFTSQGLRLDALRFSLADTNVFPNCGSTSGAKLTKVDLSGLDLVWGTMVRLDYGGAPIIQVNGVRFESGANAREYVPNCPVSVTES